jgi:serine/threonine-protein kinase
MSTVPERGQVLAGKYRIDQLLGTGGMGVVVAATHLQLKSRVAIKFLSPDAVQNEAAAARLLREARASANIKSDHVARVIDVGTLESGSPYIVMEHLEGINLANLLRKKGRLSVGEATTYVLQACDGVAHAHALGIVHRDLKPSNLFATDRRGSPTIKVLDFGLSKVTESGGHLKPDTHLTSTTDVIGSPIYMSPEQLRSTRDVDARTDIWALGTILFELIAGQPPFRARTLPQLCMLILHSRPRSLRELCPEASPALETVIRRCLEKDPAKRFDTVAQLAQALAPFASAPASGPLGVPSSNAAIAHSSTANLEAARGAKTSRLAVRFTWAMVLVGLGAAASFTFVMRSRWRHPVALSHVADHARADDSQGACALLGTTACSTCVAANCCNEYRACQANEACRQALEVYNGCVGSQARSQAATCSETFGTHPNSEARNLASCAFVKVGGPTVLPGRCAGPCEQAAIIDDACAAYCDCMKQSCQITMNPSACPSVCAQLKPDQIRCRTYHCFLGSKTDPAVHCEHAVGHLNTCL